MAPVPPGGRAALDVLLADLGARIRLGSRVEEPSPRLATGAPDVDRLLRGGLPGDRLSEIHGPPTSGRTSLVLSLLAGVTRRGECAAVVDRADALDPPSARAAGVVLERVLWVRAPERREALRCAERLLGTRGFPLVVLDWDGAATAAPGRSGASAPPGDPVWLRLSRQAAATRTALVLVARERLAGPHAEVALEMQLAGVRFETGPSWLEALETRAVLVRHRAAPVGRAAPVRWASEAAA